MEDMVVSINKLTEAAAELKSGYAFDIIESIMAPKAKNEPLEADALFRTLVLDEAYDVNEAKELWSAAMHVLEATKQI